MQYDVWTVSADSDVDYFRAAATIGAAGSLALLKTNLGTNGYGYKVSFTSDGNDSGITFTITGRQVGHIIGDPVVTETVTGPNATTVFSTNYYSQVTSITVSGTSSNSVSIGYGGDLALPRTRIKGLYYVGGGSAGSITVTSPNREFPLFKIATPDSADTFADSLFIPSEGVLVGGDAPNDYGVVTVSNVTSYTLICG
jgi:hypothetical protein